MNEFSFDESLLLLLILTINVILLAAGVPVFQFRVVLGVILDFIFDLHLPHVLHLIHLLDKNL